MLLNQLCRFQVFLVFLTLGTLLFAADRLSMHYRGQNENKVKEDQYGVPLLYSNLSCPFEWSKYSCIHQHRLIQGNASYHFALQEWTRNQALLQTWKLHGSFDHPQKILLVGDSTMRQVFIALACRFWLMNEITSYYVDWMNSWPCHGTPNCVARGNHSGFNVGRIDIQSKNNKNGLQFFFLPIGGSKNRTKEQPNILNRWRGEWSRNNTVSFSLEPEGPTHVLSKGDVIVYNIGLHLENRNRVYNTLDGFGQSLLESKTAERPTLVYMATTTQHFPTAAGVYEPNLDMGHSKYSCRSNVSSNPREEQRLQN